MGEALVYGARVLLLLLLLLHATGRELSQLKREICTVWERAEKANSRFHGRFETNSPSPKLFMGRCVSTVPQAVGARQHANIIRNFPEIFRTDWYGTKSKACLCLAVTTTVSKHGHRRFTANVGNFCECRTW